MKRAILRSNVAVIRNIVATVPIRGRKMRREPEGIDAEVFEVIEFFGDAFKIIANYLKFVTKAGSPRAKTVS